MSGEDVQALAEEIAGGDRQAARRLYDRVGAVVGDSRALAELLDPLAREAAAGGGDPLEVLVTVVDRHRLAEPAVRRLILNTHDVDDVLQDVLIRLVRSIKGFRGESRFTTWLYRLARNTAVDSLRRRREVTDLDDDRVPSDAMRLSSMIATRRSLQEMINALAPMYRDPVILRDVEQLSYEQVARKLDLKLNTTKSRVARGRAILAGMIQEAGFDGSAER